MVDVQARGKWFLVGRQQHFLDGFKGDYGIGAYGGSYQLSGGKELR